MRTVGKNPMQTRLSNRTKLVFLVSPIRLLTVALSLEVIPHRRSRIIEGKKYDDG